MPKEARPYRRKAARNALQQRLRRALLCSCYRISYRPCSVKISETTEKSPKLPPPPLFTEGESTWARSAEDKAIVSNTPQANAENEGNASL